jgi:hypothetical protein
MNVLADRHHSGLYHSVQLLGDRLGWTIYTPAGLDWWDAEYWNFGRRSYGDNRLGRQFLQLGEFDSEFPDRPTPTVTLEQARSMDWGLVLATCDDNQEGFRRFADEHGAKYAVHVGNTNQFIDHTLSPLIINASEMPGGISVGEEFDSDGLFAYSEPVNSSVISSFVNCMPEICHDHERLATSFEAFEQALGIDLYGISARNLKPIDLVAERMRESGWGYHDKPQGDGYGHVLHYWAAIGRPLIGHGGHYSTKMGYIYWRDLETCIDLDKHDNETAIELVRQISADPDRHAQMCRNIRAIFDAATDWDADAARVAELVA